MALGFTETRNQMIGPIGGAIGLSAGLWMYGTRNTMVFAAALVGHALGHYAAEYYRSAKFEGNSM